MTKTIELPSGRRIGDGEPCFVIAEAGSNWRMGTPERDLSMAFALIDVAAEAGCDAVKFQTYRADTVYVENAGESDYLADAGIKRSINEIFDDLEMPYEMIPQLRDRCRELEIEFMSTPFSIDDAKAVDPHVDFHKVASYEIGHVELLAWLARTDKPIVFSTGAATYADIDFALEHLRSNGASALAMMQCTARYPAPLDAVNLRVIPTLKERYGLPTGLSDHSRNPTTAPAGAVALGANLIEKHYTLANRLPGADHPFALEPDELAAMVDAIRKTEKALGTSTKAVGEAEEELYAFARRGVQALRAIAAGEPLVLNENIAVLRPGQQVLGAHPRHLGQIAGKPAQRAIPAGDGVHLADVPLDA